MLKLVLMNIEFIFSAKECCCWVYALLFILYCRDWSGHKEGTHLIVSIQLSSLWLEHWRLGCSFQSQFKVSSRYSHASSEQERLELEARIGAGGHCWIVTSACQGKDPQEVQFHIISSGIWALLGGFAEKAMAPHSSTLAWKIPWMEEPSGLQSMGSLRVRHDWVTSLSLFTFIHWRRKWQPTPVFLPGES